MCIDCWNKYMVTKSQEDDYETRFRATLIGWDKEQEAVWFDSSVYTKEEAEAQFKPYQGTTQKGYPYTGSEFDGKKYHDYYYLGEYEDDKIPFSDAEYFASLLEKTNKNFVLEDRVSNNSFI